MNFVRGCSGVRRSCSDNSLQSQPEAMFLSKKTLVELAINNEVGFVQKPRDRYKPGWLQADLVPLHHQESLPWQAYTHCEYHSVAYLQVPLAQVVPPVQPEPPHCP